MAKKPSYFIYIVESPSDEDLYSQRTEGKLLLEGLRLAQVSNAPNTFVEYRLVISEETFDKAMLEDLPLTLGGLKGIIPILHFSMHGDEGGLELTDGTEIHWDELAKLLSEINRNLARNKLIVCVSACRGIYGGLMHWPTAEGGLLTRSSGPGTSRGGKTRPSPIWPSTIC